MMKIFLFCIFLCMGCSRTVPYQETIDAGLDTASLQKAANFKRALSDKRAGVYLYNTTINRFTGPQGAQKLATRILLLGFTDVFVSVKFNANYEILNREWLRSFIKTLHQNNVRVYALAFGNPDEFHVDNTQKIILKTYSIIRYNQAVALDERFFGVSTDWEPHALKVGSKLGHASGLDVDDLWCDDRYGSLGANDRLLKRCLSMLFSLREALNRLSNEMQVENLTLNQVYHFSYQKKYEDGRLPHGDINRFLEVCGTLNVMCYHNKKEKIWERFEQPLQAAKKDSSLYCTVKIKKSAEEDRTSLYDQGWDYLLQTIAYLQMQCKPHRAFAGIVIFDYSGLESLWLNE